MPLIRVKDKFQVTLPPLAREKLGLKVGDLLEAQVEDGRITLTPKGVVDRELAEALEDVKRGRVQGPFAKAPEAIRSLRKPPRP